MIPLLPRAFYVTRLAALMTWHVTLRRLRRKVRAAVRLLTRRRPPSPAHPAWKGVTAQPPPCDHFALWEADRDLIEPRRQP